MRGEINLERDPVAGWPDAGNDLFLDIRQDLAVMGEGLGNADSLRSGYVAAGLHCGPAASIVLQARSRTCMVSAKRLRI